MMQRLHNRLRRFIARGRIAAPGRDGFSLVEILMVMMILSVGILPVVIIQHRARREVSESDRYTQAVSIAQSQMERIKGMGFGVAAPDSGDAGAIRWVCNVTNVSPGLDRIEVTTTWSSSQGEESMVIADLVSMR